MRGFVLSVPSELTEKYDAGRKDASSGGSQSACKQSADERCPSAIEREGGNQEGELGVVRTHFPS